MRGFLPKFNLSNLERNGEERKENERIISFLLLREHSVTFKTLVSLLSLSNIIPNSSSNRTTNLISSARYVVQSLEGFNRRVGVVQSLWLITVLQSIK
ncbi:hypothetical protein HanHA300_Chr10g0359631 [Helianthus annuus]|nr:hypothetical protein HanHA300_Chr10g0359631 [Helianthus annuus]KAJ0528944.1 hypothetical protein HanHA89_Chr10g0372121 [Helianthus annuus]KAJ0695860.1 hypothetical protein HanLR1_Chr10g0350341 [Helianthus annuus]